MADLDISYDPVEYIQRIQYLYRAVQPSGRIEKASLFQSIIDTHERFIIQQQNPKANDFNSTIKEIVLPDVYKRWEPFWTIIPLRFVVFDDFISRFPDTRIEVPARDRLLELLNEDVGHLREVLIKNDILNRNKVRLEKLLNSYLEEYFPDIDPIQL